MTTEIGPRFIVLFIVRVEMCPLLPPLVSRPVSVLQAAARLQGTRSSSVYIVRWKLELTRRSPGAKLGLWFEKQMLS